MSSLAAEVRLPRPARGRPPTPGLRESILRAAEVVFTRREYHEVQMDDVARACGVGKGTLYRYFEDKDELYLALLERAGRQLDGRIHAVKAGHALHIEFARALAAAASRQPSVSGGSPLAAAARARS